MVCNALIAGGRLLGVEQQAMRPAIIICSTCFGHSYAHHQELETILVLLPHMVCNALFAAALLLTADHQQPRHYTPYAAVTKI